MPVFEILLTLHFLFFFLKFHQKKSSRLPTGRASSVALATAEE